MEVVVLSLSLAVGILLRRTMKLKGKAQENLMLVVVGLCMNSY